MNNKKNALISVYDKSNLIELSKELIKNKYNIIATSSTHQYLLENNISSIPIYEITKFPEILSGRVKTLHPNIFAGILNIRDNKDHRLDINNHSISNIDMVIVNLYPFKNKKKTLNLTQDELIEYIDIGGVSLIRAAAKNYKYVTVVPSILEYNDIVKKLNTNDKLDISFNKILATKAFKITYEYDNFIYKNI